MFRWDFSKWTDWKGRDHDVFPRETQWTPSLSRRKVCSGGATKAVSPTTDTTSEPREACTRGPTRSLDSLSHRHIFPTPDSVLVLPHLLRRPVRTPSWGEGVRRKTLETIVTRGSLGPVKRIRTHLSVTRSGTLKRTDRIIIIMIIDGT